LETRGKKLSKKLKGNIGKMTGKNTLLFLGQGKRRNLSPNRNNRKNDI
jgi:hypothetical protein